MSHLKSRLSLATYSHRQQQLNLIFSDFLFSNFPFFLLSFADCREERRAAGVTVLILAVVGLTWTPHLTSLLWSSVRISPLHCSTMVGLNFQLFFSQF